MDWIEKMKKQKNPCVKIQIKKNQNPEICLRRVRIKVGETGFRIQVQ